MTLPTFSYNSNGGLSEGKPLVSSQSSNAKSIGEIRKIVFSDMLADIAIHIGATCIPIYRVSDEPIYMMVDGTHYSIVAKQAAVIKRIISSGSNIQIRVDGSGNVTGLIIRGVSVSILDDLAELQNLKILTAKYLTTGIPIIALKEKIGGNLILILSDDTYIAISEISHPEKKEYIGGEIRDIASTSLRLDI